MAEFDFIIPFRARSTASNWSSVCRLLEQTLASVWNSTDRRLRVLLVCHDVPDVPFDASRCEFLQVAFDPPSPSSIGLPSGERYFVWMSDKGRKVLSGLRTSRQDGSRYFMVLDADDLVSSRLVEHCLRCDDANGYFLEQGFRMDERSPEWICRRGKFHEECGSSIVLRTEVAPFPEAIDDSWDLDNHYVRRYIRHGYLPAHMRREGHPLQAVPFRAGIYRFHEENCYAGGFRLADSWLRRGARQLLTGQRVTTAIRQEFAMTPVASV